VSDPFDTRAARLAAALDDFLRSSPDVEAAAVVSFDGLPMASALPDDLDEDRVGAMSAALLSLGEQAAVGLGRGQLNQVFVQGDEGFVFLMSARDQAVLAAIAHRNAKIGFMLFEMRRTADRVGHVLEPQGAELDATRSWDPQTGTDDAAQAAVDAFGHTDVSAPATVDAESLDRPDPTDVPDPVTERISELPITERLVSPAVEPPFDTPFDEVPGDEAPVDEAPVDEAPVDEAPVDEAPVAEAPFDFPSGFDAPADDVAAPAASADQPVDDTPPGFEPAAFEPAAFEPPAFEPPAFEPPAFEPAPAPPRAYEPAMGTFDASPSADQDANDAELMAVLAGDALPADDDLPAPNGLRDLMPPGDDRDLLTEALFEVRRATGGDTVASSAWARPEPSTNGWGG